MSDADYALGVPKLFTLFFVTLGPIKLLGPFARATAVLTEAELRAMAVRAAGLATLIAIASAFLGRALLESWQVPALRPATHGWTDPVRGGLPDRDAGLRAPGSPPGPWRARGAAQPHAGRLPDGADTLRHRGLDRPARPEPRRGPTGVIIATLVVVMLLNLLSMVYVRPLLRTVGPVLLAVGSGLGLLQLALAVEIILTALHGLGVLAGAA